MTPETFRGLLAELVLDNPLAIRPFLQILEVRFTREVETLAVTADDRPTLLVNLDFVGRHCRSDAEVQALVLHEFLHILLRHTQRRGPVSEAEHLAMDAVINAIIHRQAGPEFSSMMSRYYAKESEARRILRPPTEKEKKVYEDRSGTQTPEEAQFLHAWVCLYAGHVVLDDIRELLEQMARDEAAGGVRAADGPPPSRETVLLGNHGEDAPLPSAVAEALDDVLRSMTGEGDWREALGAGVAERETNVAASSALAQWKRKAMEVLRKHVVPDARSKAIDFAAADAFLPVLSPRDRRAFLRAT